MIKLANTNKLLLSDSYDTYWKVGDRMTYSKLEALIWAHGDVGKISFHWMENTWDHVDFSVEPLSSWEELCRQRAQQIRDNHEWVCIWFSGGYDSYHVLQTFVANQIPIDEIGIFDWSRYYDDGEIPTAMRIAEWYRANINPSVKISVSNLDFDMVGKVYTDNPDWLATPGDSVRFSRPHQTLRMLANVNVKRSQDRRERADVMGYEKPRMDINNGIWRTFMPDTTVTNGAATGVCQFYSSHDMPELHVKQIHLAMRFFENRGLATHQDVHSIQSFRLVKGQHLYKDWNLGVGRVPIPNWSSAHGAMKWATSPGLSAIVDKPLLEHARQSDHKSYHIYMDGIQQLQKVLPWWDPNSDDFNKTVMVSKFYPVRAVKNIQLDK